MIRLAATLLEASSGTFNVWFLKEIVRYLAMLRRSLYQVSAIPCNVTYESLFEKKNYIYCDFSWEGGGSTLPQNSYKPRISRSVRRLARSFGTNKQTSCYLSIRIMCLVSKLFSNDFNSQKKYFFSDHGKKTTYRVLLYFHSRFSPISSTSGANFLNLPGNH